jgi:hypothetical protein
MDRPPPFPRTARGLTAAKVVPPSTCEETMLRTRDTGVRTILAGALVLAACTGTASVASDLPMSDERGGDP